MRAPTSLPEATDKQTTRCRLSSLELLPRMQRDQIDVPPAVRQEAGVNLDLHLGKALVFISLPDYSA